MESDAIPSCFETCADWIDCGSKLQLLLASNPRSVVGAVVDGGRVVVDPTDNFDVPCSSGGNNVSNGIGTGYDYDGHDDDGDADDDDDGDEDDTGILASTANMDW